MIVYLVLGIIAGVPLASSQLTSLSVSPSDIPNGINVTVCDYTTVTDTGYWRQDSGYQTTWSLALALDGQVYGFSDAPTSTISFSVDGKCTDISGCDSWVGFGDKTHYFVLFVAFDSGHTSGDVAVC